MEIISFFWKPLFRSKRSIVSHARYVASQANRDNVRATRDFLQLQCNRQSPSACYFLAFNVSDHRLVNARDRTH